MRTPCWVGRPSSVRPPSPARRVEAADGQLLAGRELAERDRAVEPREALVEDRHGLALPEHPAAPQDVGAHAHSALADDGAPAPTGARGRADAMQRP